MKSLLEVKGVTRSFYGVRVLNGVDLTVIDGTITGLIGPNGAGKSTLFNAVSGLFPPDGGQVLLDGTDITGASPRERVERGLVRTFQLARGFPKLTVFQHLMLYGQRHPGEGLLASLTGNRMARRHEHELAAEALAVAARLRLSHVIDNPVTALSGGQKKLLEIGRALMAKPR